MEKLPSVLLVDDDPTTNFLHKLLLTRQQLSERILMAEDGSAALDLLAHTSEVDQPVLILLDINMPGMGGLDFLAAYQQLPAAQRQATVIMLTTSVDVRELTRSQELGSAGVVSKPLTVEKLDSILHLHCQHRMAA